MDSNPEAELNILIDPANIGGKKTLTIMTLNIYTDAKNRTPVNLYVNGNIQFPGGSTGGNIHANIYTKGDIIVKSGASGINFHGSLFSKEGNIELEKGHSASEFYGELVYAQNNITFGSLGIIMHGTSVIGNSVNLTNTTINTIPDPNLFPDPHRIKSGSLSRKELDNYPPDENGGNDGDGGNGDPDNDSNGEVKFKVKSPLHEVDNPK